MRILVCVKVVPKVSDCKIDRETGNLIRDGVASIINPPDLAAMHMASEIKKENKAEVVVLTMGPDFFADILKAGFAMDLDEIYIISSGAFRGSDTLATSYVLQKTIEHLGKFDLILTGTRTLDGDTGQVGPQLAEALQIPSLTYAESVEIQDNKITAKRRINGGVQEERVALPALVSVLRKNLKEKDFKYEGEKEVKILTEKDIDFDEERIGMKGSRTVVANVFAPEEIESGVLIESGSDEEKVEELLKVLKEKKRI